MEKESIKVKFVDFWEGFDTPENNFIERILSDKYNLIRDDNPDYIFGSVFGNEILQYNGIRICYTAENARVDFNIYDYGIGFDHLDFGDRYIRLPNYAVNNELVSVLGAERKHTAKDIRHKFCSFIYSNAKAFPKRKELFDCLSEYKKVESSGKYLNNTGYVAENKRIEQKNFKFSIACENTCTPGYVTEKLLDAFAADTVPIYYGAPDVVKDFNPKAFINCADYKDFHEVLEFIKELDNNDELYLKMWNSPIVNDYSLAIRYANLSELKKFLVHIIEQPKGVAIRRDMFSYGKKYEDSRIYQIQCTERIGKVLKVVDAIKKLKI